MTGPSEHQVELLLRKDESLVPNGLASLKEQVAGVAPERLAIAEIAGRDSVAALLAVAREGTLDAVVPTAVYTGTEFGDWSVLFEAVGKLRGRLAGTGVRVVGELQLLGSPKLWGALNGRYMSRLAGDFGFCTPCVGCHLYVHLARVPLAWALGARAIISGERESHDGRVKVNQTAAALDAYAEVIEGAGLALALPIRGMAGGADVEALVGDDWAEGEKQLRCVLSKNYENDDGTAALDPVGFDRFLECFIVPAGRAVVEAWRDGSRQGYERIISSAAWTGEPAG